MEELIKAKLLKQKGFLYLSAIEYAIVFHRSLMDLESLNPNKIFSELERSEVLKDVELEALKIDKVLSYGSRWNDDEFMLIYTFLMEYKLLLDYFKYYELSFNLSINHIQDSLLSIQKDEFNKREARRTKGTILKNRKDLSADWLNDVLL